MKETHLTEDLIRSAVGLFATYGYANTSVQQIVAAAGVTKGALYHYFESKDDLLFGIYDSVLTVQQAHMDRIIGRGGPVDEVVRAVCIDVIETSIEYLDEGTVFFRSLSMLSADRQQEVIRRRRAYNDRFAELIELGREKRIFRDDIPTAILIAHFFSDVHYLGHWYSDHGAHGKQAVATQITDLFMTSLRRSDGPHSGT